jgi:hypothetical protein
MMSFWRYSYWHGDQMGPCVVFERVLNEEELAKLDQYAGPDHPEREIDGPFQTLNEAIGDIEELALDAARRQGKRWFDEAFPDGVIAHGKPRKT